MFRLFIFYIKVTKNLVEREAKENRIKDSGWLKQKVRWSVIVIYRIYSNKRRGAYKNFPGLNCGAYSMAALIWKLDSTKYYFNYGIIIVAINLLQN